MAKRIGKKAKKKLKRIFDKGSKTRKKLRKALKDDKISKLEIKKIRKAGATKKELQKVRKRAGKSKDLQISKKVNEKKEINKLAKNNPKPDNKNKTTKIKGPKFLDKYLEKNVLEKPIIKSPKHKKATWSPKRVERKVAKQWGQRFKSDDFKPKRLKVNVDSTGRLGKYTDKEGQFNHKQYLADVRKSAVDRAERRGFKGDAAKALSRTAPKMPGEVKPKYGSAITDLKNKLGKINYKDKIAETTSKLTQTVKSDASKYKKTGLDIIKRRSSEDGALPAIKPKQQLK